jgi:tRNA 2-thiouridine synthesizing protein E
MSVKQFAGVDVNVNAEGFLTDPKQWTPEIAAAIAQEEGIVLGDGQWKVIDFVRHDAQEHGEPPTVRRITKSGGVSTKELYDLFPGGPAKKAAKIAGYPKPHGCI